MGLWLHPYALSVRVDICGRAERIQFKVENDSMQSEWTTKKVTRISFQLCVLYINYDHTLRIVYYIFFEQIKAKKKVFERKIRSALLEIRWGRLHLD